MNTRVQNMMSNKLAQWCDTSKVQCAVDVGSYDINGTMRSVVPTCWEYIGVDRISGPNVDIVMPSDYFIPVSSSYADVVISVSCFQYVRNPFKLMMEIGAKLSPGGTVIVCVPREEKEGLIGLPPELCPDGDTSFDCWRVLKGGMTALLEDSGFSVKEVFYDLNCCWGVGKKR